MKVESVWKGFCDKRWKGLVDKRGVGKVTRAVRGEHVLLSDDVTQFDDLLSTDKRILEYLVQAG